MGAVQARDGCANIVLPTDAQPSGSTDTPRASAAHAPSEPARNALRDLPLQHVWASFGSGTCRIRKVEHTAERCFVTICRQAGQRHLASAIEWQVAEQILCGAQPKVVADQLSVSRSTVCGYWQSVMSTLCEPRYLSKALAFLVLGAASSRGTRLEPATVHGMNGQGQMLVSVRLDDTRLLAAGLSRAELEIARAVIMGKRAGEICIERQTSPRTVANQLSAIYRKFRISGRRELVIAILVRSFVMH